ncbi:MAG: HD domain-containing protein [Bacteriovoracaceae bacterium]|nr:HD domain-containing protein [Bacteriovoracaceae bacterium]
MTKSDPKIIILEHRPDYKAIYGLNLNVYLRAEILIAATVREVVSYLEIYSKSLVFIDTSGYTVDVGFEVFRYISKNNLTCPCFIVGNTKAPADVVTIFDAQMELKLILQTVAKLLKITAFSMAKKEVPPKFPLPLEFILPGWECCHPLYLKDGDQYNKILKQGDIISGDILDELEVKKVNYLYIDAHYRLKFVNSFTFQISSKLNDSSLSYQDRLKTTAKGYQMVMEQARRLGIKESTMELANDCVDSVQTLIASTPNLKTLTSNLSSESYLYRHSLLISYIGAHIIKKVKWGSKEHQKKFAFAAFFHDIVLIRDELAKYRSDLSVNKSSLPDKDKKRVLNHAVLAAQLVSKVKSIPLGTDTIIRQHHGSKNGKTLSKLEKGISPLAIVFMFSEEWAELAIISRDNDDKVQKELLLKQLQKKYNIPAFKRNLPELTLDF